MVLKRGLVTCYIDQQKITRQKLQEKQGQRLQTRAKEINGTEYKDLKCVVESQKRRERLEQNSPKLINDNKSHIQEAL